MKLNIFNKSSKQINELTKNKHTISAYIEYKGVHFYVKTTIEFLYFLYIFQYITMHAWLFHFFLIWINMLYVCVMCISIVLFICLFIMLINIKSFIFILLLHSVWLKINQIKTNGDFRTNSKAIRNIEQIFFNIILNNRHFNSDNKKTQTQI